MFSICEEHVWRRQRNDFNVDTTRSTIRFATSVIAGVTPKKRRRETDDCLACRTLSNENSDGILDTIEVVLSVKVGVQIEL